MEYGSPKSASSGGPQPGIREYILNEPIPCPASPRSILEADWTLGEALLQFRDFPEGERRNAFQFALDKPEFHPAAFSLKSSFLKDIGILAMSDISRLKAICYCHPSDAGHKTWRCKSAELCHHCNYLRFRGECNRLAESFDLHAGRRLHAITLSWNHSVPLDDDLDLALILWDALEAVIRGAHAEHLFEGTLFVKELAVSSFFPTSVRPHGHGLIFANDNIQEVIPKLEELLCSSPAWATLLATGSVPGDFRPNFHIETPATPGELRNWLYYITKVFSVAEPYAEAFARVAPHERWPLNQEVSRLMELFDMEIIRDERWGDFGKPLYRTAGRILRLGNMHWGSTAKITTAKFQWKEEAHLALMETHRLESKSS